MDRGDYMLRMTSVAELHSWMLRVHVHSQRGPSVGFRLLVVGKKERKPKAHFYMVSMHGSIGAPLVYDVHEKPHQKVCCGIRG